MLCYSIVCHIMLYYVTCTNGRMCVPRYIHMYMHICAPTHTYVYIHIYIYTYIYVYIYVCINICTICIGTCMSLSLHIYTHVYVYVYVYAYVCAYTGSGIQDSKTPQQSWILESWIPPVQLVPVVPVCTGANARIQDTTPDMSDMLLP